jgi:carbon starvation protein CstA
MHQINDVASLKILPVWKVHEKIDYFLKGMSVGVGVFFLFCSFTIPFPNTTSMFFTISNISFPVFYFEALSFSTVLSK